MIAKKTTLASKISVTTIILLSSLYSNASVNKLFLRLLSFLLTSFSIVLNSSVSNLCHLVSPKVVGLFKSVPSVGFCVSRRRWTNPFRVGLLASYDECLTIIIRHFRSEVIYKVLLCIRYEIHITEYLNPIIIPLCTWHLPMGSVMISEEWC